MRRKWSVLLTKEMFRRHPEPGKLTFPQATHWDVWLPEDATPADAVATALEDLQEHDAVRYTVTVIPVMD